MRIMAKTATALTLALLVTGCGQKSASTESQAPPAGQPAAGAAATFTLPAGLDDGPRAAATPANPVMAARGEKLFQTGSASASRAPISTASPRGARRSGSPRRSCTPT